MQKEYVPREIKSIKFELMGEEETKSISVLGVTSRDLYTSEGKAPAIKGPLDLRLGPSTKDNLCKTCNEAMAECTGHFGHIELPLPVYHPGLLKSTHKILQSICKKCSSVLLPEDTITVLLSKIRSRKDNRPGVQRVVKKVLDEAKKASECFKCGAVNGAVRRNGFRFFHRIYRLKKHDLFKQEYIKNYKNAEKDNSEITPWVESAPDEYISPVQALSLMQRMKESECELFGMACKPAALLLQTLPVSPGTIRPSVISIDASSNEDDLTIKMSEIVYTAQQIKDEIQKGSFLHTLSDTWDLLQIQCAQLISTDTRADSTKMRSFVQRLKGKHGRFRGNLSGKRVEFSGRTVISPDPNLSVEEVGIPRRMAQILSIPMIVTEKNLEEAQEMSKRGCDIYPGANYLIRDSKRLFLRPKNSIKIDPGDVLERHLCTGDVVLFNRQPSLHKLSIMAHKVKVLPGRTLRFNECVCAPYNADFDGDEMNVHVPQTVEARVEALEIMGVKNNLVVPRNGQPLIAATQDFITGAYLISSKDVFLSSDEAAQMVVDACTSSFRVNPTVLRPKRLYTGKSVLQSIMNLTATAEIRTRGYKAGDNWRSYKETLFVVKKGEILFGRVDKRVIGSEEGSVLHYEMQKRTPEAVISALNGLARVCARYMGRTGFSIGLDDVHAPATLKESVREVIDRCEREAAAAEEDKAISLLSSAREEAGALCVKELGSKNAAVLMQACGSKGSLINVSQMVGSVGQQIVGGQRIALDFGQRSLPHFREESGAPSSRGFVRSSFCAGLEPTEFFFHAVSGREGLVDTAVKTAETGYMQRRLMKVLEGVFVAYDNTVRRGDQLIQMRFGDDGLDPSLMQGGSLDADMPAALDWVTQADQTHQTHSTNPDKEKISKEIEKIVIDKWEIICEEGKINRDIWDIVNKEIGYLLFTGSNSIVLEKMEKYLLKKSVDIKSRISALFVSRMLYRVVLAQIECGTAVGALAAQSIGEPGTQMTLKTFHLAGTSGASITLGVPRLKEIINGAVNISTPIIKIETKEDIEKVKKRIQPVALKDIVSAVSVGDLSAVFEIEKKEIEKYGIEKEVERLGARFNENIYRLELPLTAATAAEIEKHLKIHILGVQSISRTLVTDEGLLAEGTGLSEILGIEGVDMTETRTNNVYEVYKTLGIEAARETIVREILYTIGKHGISVDVRHVGLLADVMCFTGEICGMTRFGLHKLGGSSVLTLASFEQTGDHLFAAGYAGHEDPVSGVSECIITGQRIPIGTGSFKICYDMD